MKLYTRLSRRDVARNRVVTCREQPIELRLSTLSPSLECLRLGSDGDEKDDAWFMQSDPLHYEASKQVVKGLAPYRDYKKTQGEGGSLATQRPGKEASLEASIPQGEDQRMHSSRLAIARAI